MFLELLIQVMEEFKLLSLIILKRQSIYPGSFTGELIEDRMIEQLLLNANNAPSHKHTEPWRFHVISDFAKDRFSDFMQDLYKSKNLGSAFKQIKYDKIAKKINQSSHIIVIGMQRHKEINIPQWEEIAAVSCAVQNIYLSVVAAGLGGYWSTPSYLLENAHSFLEMEINEICLGIFYLGIPKKDLPPPIVKKPIEEKSKWYRE